MRIDAVKPIRGALAALTLSDGRTVSLDRSLCEREGLRVGSEIKEEALADLARLSDYERAKSRALWYLDRADVTEQKLLEKLAHAGFSPESNRAVVARLAELGVVDDRRFAERFCERCREANVSKRQTYAKLLEKGVPRALAGELLADWDPADEAEAVRALLATKYRGRLADPESRRKVYAALIRRGFSYAAVREVFRPFCEELENVEEDFS